MVTTSKDRDDSRLNPDLLVGPLSGSICPGPMDYTDTDLERLVRNTGRASGLSGATPPRPGR